MGHEIPIFFAPIEKTQSPNQLNRWVDAAELLNELLSAREENEVYIITSRNWWHLYTLRLFCDELKIAGLEFASVEIVLLETESLI